MENATTSQINTGLVSADSSDFYEYIQVVDDGYDSVNVINQPSYVPYYISLIFAVGILSGIIWGYISAWKA